MVEVIALQRPISNRPPELPQCITEIARHLCHVHRPHRNEVPLIISPFSHIEMYLSVLIIGPKWKQSWKQMHHFQLHGHSAVICPNSTTVCYLVQKQRIKLRIKSFLLTQILFFFFFFFNQWDFWSFINCIGLELLIFLVSFFGNRSKGHFCHSSMSTNQVSADIC